MNAKITLVELTELMAESSSTTPKVCELFLRELFATISQSLINGESVKVKGIGTFKITRVKPRKSVNVSSGEAIQLTAHDKLTFTPDKSLADAVNQPFALFETVYLDDAVTEEKLAERDEQYPSLIDEKDDEGDPEINGPIAAIAAAAVALPGAAKKAVAEPEPLAAAPEPAITPQPEPAVEPEPVVEPEPEPVAEPKPVVEPKPEPVAEPEPEPMVEPEPEPVAKPVVEPVVEPEPEQPAARVAPAMAKPIDGPGRSAATLQPAPAAHEMPERKPMLVGIPIDGPSQPVPEPEPEEETNADSHFYRPEPRNAYTPTPEQIEEANRRPNRTWLWALLGALGVGLLVWSLTRCTGDGNSAAEQQQEIVASDTLTDEQVEQIKQEAEKEKAAKEKAEKEKVEKEKAALEKAEKEKAAKEEAEKSAQAAKSKETGKSAETTDVVTSQIVLTTLSEKYYGSPWFWVYIYEENVKRGIINDPNRIRPGTRVVIPPAEKYGIDANDKAALRKAQIKSMEYLK